jgi:uncharacterized protein (TIGR02147 family)
MGLKSHLVLKKILNKDTLIKKSHYAFLNLVLELDGNEEYYFLALVDLLHAKTIEERNLYQLTLNSLSPGEKFDVKILDNTEIFRNWINMAILSLSKIKNQNWNAEKVLQSLSPINPQLTLEDINKSIGLLVQNEVLVVDENNEITNLYNRVTTRTAVRKVDSHLYYDQVSDLSKSASRLESFEQKEFQCFSTPLKNIDIPQVQSLIRDLRNKISKIAGDGSEADEVFQINLQLFPLSDNKKNGFPISGKGDEILHQPSLG